MYPVGLIALVGVCSMRGSLGFTIYIVLDLRSGVKNELIKP